MVDPDGAIDPVGRFDENMRAGEALRPTEVRASATRCRQLADSILDRFHELVASVEASQEEQPEGLGDARLQGERLREQAERLLAFADRADQTKLLVSRLCGLPPEAIGDGEKKDLALSLQQLYDPLQT